MDFTENRGKSRDQIELIIWHSLHVVTRYNKNEFFWLNEHVMNWKDRFETGCHLFDIVAYYIVWN